MISRCLGAGDRQRARQASAFCIWSAGVLALCYGVLVALGRDALLPLLGADGATTAFCGSYLFWTVGIGAAPTVLSAALAHLIRAEGYSGQASFGVAFGGILNIILDPIFIFVFKLEIAGAAIATMLSNLAATLFFLGFLFRIRRVSAITVSPACFSLGGGIAAEVLSVGLPSFVMTLMSTCSNLCLNKIISGYSNEAVAGMGVAKKIDLLAAIRTLLLCCIVLALGGTALMILCAAPITRCFINDAATVAYGKDFLRIVALACPSTALNFLSITIFQATGRRRQPLILSLLRKGGLDIPLMLLFNRLSGVRGVAWATPIADLVALCVSAALVLPYLKTLSPSNEGKLIP